MDKVDEFLWILNKSLNEIYIFEKESLRFCWVNETALSNLQYSMDELRQMTPLDIKNEFNIPNFKILLSPLADDSKQKIMFETTHQRKDLSKYDIQVHLQTGLFKNKPVYIAIILDVSILKKQNKFIEKLEQKEQVFSKILDDSLNEIYIFHHKTLKFLWANKSALHNTGHSMNELKSLTPLDLKTDYTPKYFNNILSSMGDKNKIVFETIHRRDNGTQYPVEVHLQKGVFQERKVYIAIALDITQRKEKEKEIKQLINEKNYQSLHDYLTQLPNRRALNKYLENKSVDRIFNPDDEFTVLFIDLDNFKTINDTQGHQFGDKLLKVVSERFKSLLSDKDFLGRFGGDEFVIVLSSPISTKKIKDFCIKLLTVLKKPIYSDKNYNIMTASIGIASAPKDASTPEKLIQYADFAHYQSKNAGKNQYQFYNEKEHQKVINAGTLISKIRKGVEQKEFSFVVQPILEMRSKNIIGAELFIRWESDNRIFTPNQFIPLLEKHNSINIIDDWLMGELSIFIEKNGRMIVKPFKLCLNASSNQLSQISFFKKIESLIKQNNLQNIQLEIEVTENVLMKEVRKNIHFLDTFKKLGFNIAVDDFGTGYSSLESLKALPLDTLKISRNYIENINNQINQGIIKTILTFAETLSLTVVAKGIESKEQLSTLSSLVTKDKLPSIQVQGFYFYRPMPLENLFKLL